MGRKGGGKSSGKNKGGRTISTLKRSNQKRQKLVKAGKLKPKSTPRFVEGGHLKGKTTKKVALKPEEIAEKERIRKEETKQWEDEAYAELGEMMDPEDLEYLKKVYKNKLDKKSKKKSSNEDNGDEDEYESKVLERHNRLKEEEQNQKSVKTLLPIRTKDGKWVTRSREVEAGNGEKDEAEGDGDANEEDEPASSDDSESDGDDDEKKIEKPVSVVEIVAKRRALLAEAKIQIGTMSSNFLELPEERLNVLQRLCRMMGGAKDKESGVDVSVQFTVAKLAAASLLEIYKDTLPNYIIGDHEEADKTVKLKKDTLRLHKFETGLMSSVKNYLVRLSKATREAAAVKDLASPIYSLGKYCLECLCQLFVAHPNFNFTSHVVQFLVPLLNSGKSEFRAIVAQTLEEVFRADKRGDVSFTIVKQINHFLKTKKTTHKIHEEVLMPLLSLKLYHLNDNQLTENNDAKQLSAAAINRKNAKGLSKKNKHIAEPILSKREKKRQKERSKLDKQLLEARGEESTQARLRFATDITNILFAIYFRVLKTITSGYAAGSMSSGIKLLHPVLNGLAKFGHLMSIEYFQDVLATFKVLLEGDSIPIQNYEKLLCLKTVFAILSGQGDNLTLDPARFYTILNQILIQLDLNDDEVHTTLKEKEYFSKGRQTKLALAVLRDALIVRRKKVARSTVAPTLKNVSISMLSLSSASAVEYIKFLREALFVAHPQMAPMLLLEGEAEEDGSIGHASSGVNLPTAAESDPFGISSRQSLMWEAALMLDHVSPAVTDAAANLLASSNSKPRKRRSPLSIPAEAKSESFDKTEVDENFDILSTKLPDTIVMNGRSKKMRT